MSFQDWNPGQFTKDLATEFGQQEFRELVEGWLASANPSELQNEQNVRGAVFRVIAKMPHMMRSAGVTALANVLMRTEKIPMAIRLPLGAVLMAVPAGLQRMLDKENLSEQDLERAVTRAWNTSKKKLDVLGLTRGRPDTLIHAAEGERFDRCISAQEELAASTQPAQQPQQQQGQGKKGGPQTPSQQRAPRPVAKDRVLTLVKSYPNVHLCPTCFPEYAFASIVKSEEEKAKADPFEELTKEKRNGLAVMLILLMAHKGDLVTFYRGARQLDGQIIDAFNQKPSIMISEIPEITDAERKRIIKIYEAARAKKARGEDYAGERSALGSWHARYAGLFQLGRQFGNAERSIGNTLTRWASIGRDMFDDWSTPEGRKDFEEFMKSLELKAIAVQAKDKLVWLRDRTWNAAKGLGLLALVAYAAGAAYFLPNFFNLLVPPESWTLRQDNAAIIGLTIAIACFYVGRVIVPIADNIWRMVTAFVSGKNFRMPGGGIPYWVLSTYVARQKMLGHLPQAFELTKPSAESGLKPLKGPSGEEWTFEEGPGKAGHTGILIAVVAMAIMLLTITIMVPSRFPYGLFHVKMAHILVLDVLLILAISAEMIHLGSGRVPLVEKVKQAIQLRWTFTWLATAAAAAAIVGIIGYNTWRFFYPVVPEVVEAVDVPVPAPRVQVAPLPVVPTGKFPPSAYEKAVARCAGTRPDADPLYCKFNCDKHPRSVCY